MSLYHDLLKTWNRIPARWQYEIKSGFHTFVTASAIEAGIQYQIYGNAFPTDKGVLLAILAVIVRAGLKAVLAFVFSKKAFAPVKAE